MSAEPETINETANEIINEEVNETSNEKVNEANIEEVKQETTKEPTKEEEQLKNKTDRLKHKKVNCKDCGANLTLKTMRYTQKCSKTEDKAVRPKPKAKPKIKAVPVQVQHNEVIEETEPVYLKQTKQNVIEETKQPVNKSPQEIIYDNYKLLQQEYINKKKEKTNALFQDMISGNLRKKQKIINNLQ